MKKELIQKIVRASGIKKGELVLIHFWGDNENKEIAEQFVIETAALGASPFLLMQSRSINKKLFMTADEESFSEAYFEKLSGFDVILDVFAYQPIVIDLPEEKMPTYRRYIRSLFYKLMEAKKFLQIRLPTAENAKESGLMPEDFISRMEAAYDIDYEELRQEAEKMEVLKAREILLHTEGDHTLRLSLSGRKWHIDAGDGDMPRGEIYIAPIEEATNGSISFKTLFFEGNRYENVLLEIENGIVAHTNIPELQAFFDEQAPENKTVCELGFGLNKNVRELCGYTVLDEKMAGSFHIAIGANTMFGGKNKAPLHIDLVGQADIEVIQ